MIISKKHGLNPSIVKCVVCNKDYSIALCGRIKGDAKAPREIINGICENCRKIINSGKVFVIEVEKQEQNPIRTGRQIAINKEAITIPNNGVVLCIKREFELMFGQYFKDKK